MVVGWLVGCESQNNLFLPSMTESTFSSSAEVRIPHSLAMALAVSLLSPVTMRTLIPATLPVQINRANTPYYRRGTHWYFRRRAKQEMGSYLTLLNSSWDFGSDHIVDTENGVENEIFSFHVENAEWVLRGDVRVIGEVSVGAHDRSEGVVSHMLDTSQHFFLRDIVDLQYGIVRLASPLRAAGKNHFRSTLDVDSANNLARRLRNQCDDTHSLSLRVERELVRDFEFTSDFFVVESSLIEQLQGRNFRLRTLLTRSDHSSWVQCDLLFEEFRESRGHVLVFHQVEFVFSLERLLHIVPPVRQSHFVLGKGSCKPEVSIVI